MGLSLLSFIYLVGSVTFILGLKMLSHPDTARKGNLVATAGMTLAIIGTIFLYEENGERLHNHLWIFGGLLIGSITGWIAAKKVKMTAMPEMVGLFNGFGGLASLLVGWAEYEARPNSPVVTLVSIFLTILIGARASSTPTPRPGSSTSTRLSATSPATSPPK